MLGGFWLPPLLILWLARAQHLPLPAPPYDFEELEPDFDGAATRRHHREVFGFHVQKFNRALQLLRHTPAYRGILKHGGIDGLLRRMKEVPLSVRKMIEQHAGGYVNHELFFRSLTPNRGRTEHRESNEPAEGTLLSAIEHIFGSFADFREAFTSTAQQLVGSGWVWLVVDSAAASEIPVLEIVETEKNGHVLQLSPSYVPLLCLDVWEHAYFGQFYNDRRKYIDAWWNLVNWETVSEALDTQQREMVSSQIGSDDAIDIDFRSDAQAEMVISDDLSFAEPATFEASQPIDTGWSDTPHAQKLYSGDANLGKVNGNFVEAPPDESCASIDMFFSQLRVEGIAGLRCARTERCPPCRNALATGAFSKGDVIVRWPPSLVLGLSPPLPSLPGEATDDPLSLLAAALIIENRRQNSTWHSYLEYLHKDFGSVRRSALFWPKRALAALNLTLGLTDLKQCARTHRKLEQLFRSSPNLLEFGEDSQKIFDAELHWAVSLALCRGLADEESGKRLVLPGSELLIRGDRESANVALQQNNGSWELVALRAIEIGQPLVLKSAVANTELLARGWAMPSKNSHGPVIQLPMEKFNKGTVWDSLAEADNSSGEMSEVSPKAKRLRSQWREHHCADELREPRLYHQEALAFSRSLALCVAFAIRLLESQRNVLADKSEDASSSDSLSRYSKSEVLFGAYQLIAGACREALNQYHEATAILVASDRSGHPNDAEVEAELHSALVGDAALLERCLEKAEKKSERHRLAGNSDSG